jgi:tyrosine-specific transport protein
MALRRNQYDRFQTRGLKMNSKLLGGTLLIIGTTIGAGMLALPIATAQLGFWVSSGLLIFCWAIMTLCAFLFLEVNLWLPPETNLISMVGATLGRPGQVIAWLAYLMLLYSILSAYIAGGGDLFHYLLLPLGISIAPAVASLIFTAIFGVVVYFGIQAVDFANRFLMFGKMGAYLLLVILAVPFITTGNLYHGHAFTCLMIIPSLRTYFGKDVKSLRIAIVAGTLIPLICYIAWDAIVMGVIPLDGTPGLRGMIHSSTSNSDFVSALVSLMRTDTIGDLLKFFTSICMATSFLSVSLSLSDFLSDGFNVKKAGFTGNALILGATFVPPILVVLFYPEAFMGGLKLAGVSCFILMILFPPLMVWSGRYVKMLDKIKDYQVAGGKFLLSLLIAFGTVMIGIGVLSLR